MNMVDLLHIQLPTLYEIRAFLPVSKCMLDEIHFNPCLPALSSNSDYYDATGPTFHDYATRLVDDGANHVVLV